MNELKRRDADEMRQAAEAMNLRPDLLEIVERVRSQIVEGETPDFYAGVYAAMEFFTGMVMTNHSEGREKQILTMLTCAAAGVAAQNALLDTPFTM